MKNKIYYGRTDAFSVAVVVAHDDSKTCIVWDVDDIKAAKEMDFSDVINFSSDQMIRYCPDRVSTFDPNEFDEVVEI